MTQLGTRLLTLSIGGSDFTAEVDDVQITSNPADAGFTPFSATATGGAREYRCTFNAVQDPGTGTLWDKVWTAAGTTVAGIIKPAGGTTASPTQPHFTFNATITEPDGTILGGPADSSTSARFTFGCSWVCTAKPTRVTA